LLVDVPWLPCRGGVNASLAIPVVDVAGSLAVTLSPNSLLQLIQCTTAYQRVTATAVATLSDATVYTVTTKTTFGTSDATVATVSSGVW
jgi:hypothetical protein